MEKIVEQGLLYDFYGPLLTKHQQAVYEQAVYENLSLNEIAEREGVSKQAVHDLLRRCTQALEGYEEKLHAIRTFERIQRSADRLAACAEAFAAETAKQAQTSAAGSAQAADSEKDAAAEQSGQRQSVVSGASFARQVMTLAQEIRQEIR